MLSFNYLRTRHLCAAAALAGLTYGAALTAGAVQTFSEPAWTGPIPSETRKASAELHEWLVANRAGAKGLGGLTISLSPSDRAAIGEANGENGGPRPTERRLQVGVSKDVGLDVQFAGARKSGVQANGVFRPTASGFVWTLPVSSKNATALRFHFRDFYLPTGAALYVYNDHGQAFGPYTGAGPVAKGAFWSHTVFGSQAYVQVHYDGAMNAKALADVRFTLASVAHVGPRFLLARQALAAANNKAFCSFNEDCVENASCSNLSSAIENARGGIAEMLFSSGAGQYICTGGLLNDTDDSSQVPLFLTANHCISSSGEASSLETFFNYTTPCGGECSFPSTASTLGATILATGSSSDYTLMQLSEQPPTGAVFLGWNNTAVANSGGTNLFRISHPGGAPQAYSEHDVDTSTGTCRTLPRGDFIYSMDTFGATEGGSSGSPVLNASAQVVGQLYGACGTNLDDVCDAQNNATVDGALAAYYSNVAEFLDPDDGGGDPPGDVQASVADINVTTSSQGPWNTGRATITVVDADGNPVPNATVSGAFSGDISGSGSGVTDSNGVAVIESDRTRSSLNSLEFCVSNISGTGITYAPGGNVEDCDSIGDGGGGGEAVDAIVSDVNISTRTRGPWTSGVATVTVVDGNGSPLPNVNVSGTFSGDVSGSGSATTDSSGVAVLESDRTRSSVGNVGFCVNDVSGSNVTYVPGSEAC